MKHLFTFTLLFYSLLVNAQREETLNNCGTEYSLERNYDSQFEQFYQNQIELKSKNPVTYYIPVVFHIIHIGEPLGYGSNNMQLLHKTYNYAYK